MIRHRGTGFSASQVAFLNLRNERSLVSLSFNILKTMTNINYIPSPYRAVNTLPLCYKNQSVNLVQGNNRCLFSDPHNIDMQVNKC